jgi:hypothetical protein
LRPLIAPYRASLIVFSSKSISPVRVERGNLSTICTVYRVLPIVTFVMCFPLLFSVAVTRADACLGV